MAPPLLPLLLVACTSDPAATEAVPHPADSPRWSTAKHLRIAPLDAVGERALILDMPGGPIDRLLADPDVTTVLTDRFSTVFLHPRARPELTARFGWPSVTLVDGDGCLRATARAPHDPAAMIALLNEALRRRRDDVRLPLPPIRPHEPAPGGHGVWTTDDPAAAVGLLDPSRGAPALVRDGRGYFYGNRRDAALFPDTADMVRFVERLPPGALAAPEAQPSLRCPLPEGPAGG